MDYVLDLETFGTNNDSPVVAIGLCSFNRETFKVGERKFYVAIDPDSACKFGARADGDTIRWWMTQSEEARDAITNQEYHVTAQTAAAMLLQFLAGDQDFPGDNAEFDEVVLWGNGPSFDCGVLESFMERVGVIRPWKHWNERCVRTLLDLYPDCRVPFPAHKTKHNALDDAEHEADCMVLAFAEHARRAAVAATVGKDEEG